MVTSRVVPDRVRRAVDVVAPGAHDRVLEIGCGPGAAAELVCARLTGTGRMVAADRSEVAIRRAGERNADHVASGRLDLRCAALADLDVPDASVDVAFSVNVNLFWTRDPGPELEVLRRVLVPDGRLFVLFGGAAPTGVHRTLDVVRGWLHAHGWTTAGVPGEHGVGVSARPR